MLSGLIHCLSKVELSKKKPEIIKNNLTEELYKHKPS